MLAPYSKPILHHSILCYAILLVSCNLAGHDSSAPVAGAKPPPEGLPAPTLFLKLHRSTLRQQLGLGEEDSGSRGRGGGRTGGVASAAAAAGAPGEGLAIVEQLLRNTGHEYVGWRLGLDEHWRRFLYPEAPVRLQVREIWQHLGQHFGNILATVWQH